MQHLAQHPIALYLLVGCILFVFFVRSPYYFVDFPQQKSAGLITVSALIAIALWFPLLLLALFARRR